MQHKPFARLTGTAAAVAVTLSACTDGVPIAPDANFDHAKPRPETAHVTLCKVGTSADFSVTDDTLTTSVSLLDGDCVVVATSEILDGVPTPKKTVSITEIVPVGVTLDRIVVDSLLVGLPVVTTVLNGTDTWSSVLHDDVGFVVTYFNNVVPPSGGEGCTPGYWKQRHHFDSWTDAGFVPTDLFTSAGFEDAFPGLSLHDVVSLKGGGLNRLGAHTMAALLNASSPGVSYDFTAAEVVQAFNDVYPGTKDDYNAVKDMFEASNEMGCDLN